VSSQLSRVTLCDVLFTDFFFLLFFSCFFFVVFVVIPHRRLERDLFRAWCQWLCYPSRSSKEEKSNQRQFQKVAQGVDSILESTKGSFFLDTFSTVDIVFAPYIERMAASLFYYKGFDLKGNNPNIHNWFKAMEARPTYVGTQSDYHTHAHDLPPQMGGCYSNRTPAADKCAALVDSGSCFEIPEVDHAEPETALQEAVLRTIKFHETLIAVNPASGRHGEHSQQVDEAMRCVLTRMVTGDDSLAPPTGTDVALRYLRDRVNVPRDMSIHAGRKLRSALEATAAMDGTNQGPNIPIKHRRDQNLLPFRKNT
jgi:glutathione S-transferase